MSVDLCPDYPSEGPVWRTLADTVLLLGCAGVAHVASNLTFDSNPNAVIPEVLAGMKNTLRAAAKHASVKRFVYTSSSTAATAPKPNKRFHVDADTWNEEQVEQAWAPPPYNADRSWAVYGASKTQAERECWRFVREEKPSFVLSTVLPNCNIGRIMSKEQPASTAGWFKKLWEGDEGTKQMLMKEIPPQYYINVRDTALLHVAALVEEDVRGERLFAFAGPFNYDMVAEAMNKMGVPNELELVGGMAEDLSTVDTKRPEELLKRYGRSGFTGLEESLRENVAAI